MAAGEIRQGHQLRSLHAPRGGGDHGPTARAARVRDRRRKFVDNTDRGNKPDHADGDPRPAAVTFVTTEHFTLQGARSSTISESTGRASVFLGAVSGGLIALGLVATATKTGVAFYTFGLILLPTLAFVGLATFHRVLQSGIEDLAYARRIAQLRDYYFDHAPELAGYLLNPAESLPTPGLGIGLWQQFLTVAGMVAVITSVLAGSAGVAPRRPRGRELLIGGPAEQQCVRRRQPLEGIPLMIVGPVFERPRLGRLHDPVDSHVHLHSECPHVRPPRSAGSYRTTACTPVFEIDATAAPRTVARAARRVNDSSRTESLRSVLRACQGGDVDDRAELRVLNEEFVAACRAGSWERLRVIVDEEFRYLEGRTGQRWDEARYVADLRAHPSPSLRFDEVDIHVAGPA